MALPVVALLLVAVTRKSTTPSNVLEITGEAILTAQTIFEDREFMEVRDEHLVQRELADLLSPLILDPKQLDQANKSCWGMIKAYGTADWDLFRSTRIPTPGYEISPDAVKFMAMLLPKHRLTDPLAMYQEVWEHSLKGEPLFTEISFLTNAINLQTIAKERIGGLTFARLGIQKGQRFVESSPFRVIDYTTRTFPAQGEAIVLSLSFFAKLGPAVSPIMIAFAWDDQDSQWVPIKMSQGLAVTPISQVHCF